MSWTNKKRSLPFMGHARPRKRTDSQYAERNPDDNKVLSAHLRKMKQNRRRWFVLYRSTEEHPAQLEYHDDERHWRAGCPPKDEIVLKECLNIMEDHYHSRGGKYVILVYKLDETLGMIFENENDLKIWLDQLLSLQQEGRYDDGRIPRPFYDHMWQVRVKGFRAEDSENSFSISGQHRIGVTDTEIRFFPLGTDKSICFPRGSLRGYCCRGNTFIIETGRASRSGAGRITIFCDNAEMAADLNSTVLSTMESSSSLSSLHHGHHGSSSSNRRTTSTSSSSSLHRPRSESWNSHSRSAISTSVPRTTVTTASSSSSSSAMASATSRGSSMAQQPSSTSSSSHHHQPPQSRAEILVGGSNPVSRYRTTSEGNHQDIFRLGRGRVSSAFSGSPLSPSPGSYMSSESAGSSNSIDDTDMNPGTARQISNNEANATIFEESSAESWHADPNSNSRIEASTSGTSGRPPPAAQPSVCHLRTQSADLIHYTPVEANYASGVSATGNAISTTTEASTTSTASLLIQHSSQLPSATSTTVASQHQHQILSTSPNYTQYTSLVDPATLLATPGQQQSDTSSTIQSSENSNNMFQNTIIGSLMSLPPTGPGGALSPSGLMIERSLAAEKQQQQVEEDDEYMLMTPSSSGTAVSTQQQQPQVPSTTSTTTTHSTQQPPQTEALSTSVLRRNASLDVETRRLAILNLENPGTNPHTSTSLAPASSTTSSLPSAADADVMITSLSNSVVTTGGITSPSSQSSYNPLEDMAADEKDSYCVMSPRSSNKKPSTQKTPTATDFEDEYMSMSPTQRPQTNDPQEYELMSPVNVALPSFPRVTPTTSLTTPTGHQPPPSLSAIEEAAAKAVVGLGETPQDEVDGYMFMKAQNSQHHQYPSSNHHPHHHLRHHQSSRSSGSKRSSFCSDVDDLIPGAGGQGAHGSVVGGQWSPIHADVDDEDPPNYVAIDYSKPRSSSGVIPIPPQVAPGGPSTSAASHHSSASPGSLVSGSTPSSVPLDLQHHQQPPVIPDSSMPRAVSYLRQDDSSFKNNNNNNGESSSSTSGLPLRAYAVSPSTAAAATNAARKASRDGGGCLITKSGSANAGSSQASRARTGSLLVPGSSSSKLSSSRVSISPFGRTPPTSSGNSLTGASPNLITRFDNWFRSRAGSVPSRPDKERRRHRTQSEGEQQPPD